MIPKDDFQLHDDMLIMALPESEYGRAFLSRLKRWLAEKEDEYFLNFRISDDPLQADFRFRAGAIWMLKQVLNEPSRIRQDQLRKI